MFDTSGCADIPWVVLPGNHDRRESSCSAHVRFASGFASVWRWGVVLNHYPFLVLIFTVMTSPESRGIIQNDPYTLWFRTSGFFVLNPGHVSTYTVDELLTFQYVRNTCHGHHIIDLVLCLLYLQRALHLLKSSCFG